MAKSLRRRSPAVAARLRRRHRAQILCSLIAICRQLDGREAAPEARRACREVIDGLQGALARESRGRRLYIKVQT
jgi:hypothetical protein